MGDGGGQDLQGLALLRRERAQLAQGLFQLRPADGLGLVLQGDDGGIDLQGFQPVEELQGFGGHQALGLDGFLLAALPALLHHFIQVVDVVEVDVVQVVDARVQVPGHARCR